MNLNSNCIPYGPILGTNQQQTSNHGLNDERIQPYSEGDDSEIEILNQGGDSVFKGLSDEDTPQGGGSSIIDTKSQIMTESHQL